MTNEQIAELCHETNRAYCRLLGDHSQPAWSEAPEWAKTSARNGVAFHLSGDGNFNPEASHENWLREKVAAGWVYGPEKRPDLKQHPCCVPYGELPEAQRRKDALFTAVVRACR
jgi:hypothetical protein